jgi:hypothetical protein
MAGILTFSALSFLDTGPTIWLLLGFIALSVFFFQSRISLLIFLLIIIGSAVPQPNTFWSPYYRLDFNPLISAEGVSSSEYSLVTNHVVYQGILNLSPDFLRSQLPRQLSEVTTLFTRCYYEAYTDAKDHQIKA